MFNAVLELANIIAFGLSILSIPFGDALEIVIWLTFAGFLLVITMVKVEPSKKREVNILMNVNWGLVGVIIGSVIVKTVHPEFFALFMNHGLGLCMFSAALIIAGTFLRIFESSARLTIKHTFPVKEKPRAPVNRVIAPSDPLPTDALEGDTVAKVFSSGTQVWKFSRGKWEMILSGMWPDEEPVRRN